MKTKIKTMVVTMTIKVRIQDDQEEAAAVEIIIKITKDMIIEMQEVCKCNLTWVASIAFNNDQYSLSLRLLMLYLMLWL